tara:strand:- start:12365 stop:12556 length:192 start_codon:yes stop_codon:yes gene_type:complete
MTAHHYTSNQICALAGEYGVVFLQGIQPLQRLLADALADAENGLSAVIRSLRTQELILQMNTN